MLPSVSEMEAYIRQVAAQVGIDPDVAVRVARSEGLKEGVWQSNVVKNGVREPSYGPFQLYEGGGLGNKFKSQFGVSASDPSTWKQQISFALGEAKKGGWSPWYGARNTGIGNFEGIRTGASAPGPSPVSVGPTQGQGSNASPEASYETPQVSFAPSQGAGEAAQPTLLDTIKSRVGNLSDFGDYMQQSSLMPAQPSYRQQKAAPMQVNQTRYTAQQQNDPLALLRQLGLM